MLLRHSLGLPQEAARVEEAVGRVLHDGARTADLARPGQRSIGTKEMGECVRRALAGGGRAGRLP